MKIIIYFLLFHHALSSNLQFHLDYNYQKFEYQTDYSYSDLYITAGGTFFDGGSTSNGNKIYYYEYLEDIE